MSIADFLNEISTNDYLYPIHNLEIGINYQYMGEDDVFNKSFIFKVVADQPDKYIIVVAGVSMMPLDKTFELVESINQQKIVRIGTDEFLHKTLTKIGAYDADIE